MKDLVKIPNAIWWLQMRLARNWRMLYHAGLYLGALIAGTMVYRQFDTGLTARASAYRVVGFVALLQVLTLTMRGAAAIFKTVNRDYTIGMIESHRMSPISGLAITTGYMFGATVPSALLYFAGLIFGAVLLATSSVSAVPWIVGNGMLLAASLMVWSMVVFAGTGTGKPINPMGLLISVGLGGIFLGQVMPAFGMLTGSVPALAAYHVMRGNLDTGSENLVVTSSDDLTIPNVCVISFGCLLLAVFWLWAAARRFRQTHRSAFDARHGTLLLLIFLLASVIGQRVGERVFQMVDEAFIKQPNMPFFIFTLVAGMIFAIVPLYGAAIDRARLVRGAYSSGWGDRLSSRWVILLAVVMICEALMLAGIRWDSETGAKVSVWLTRANASKWAYTAAALLTGLLTVDGFLRWMMLRPRPTTGQLGGFLLAVWALPPAIDFIVAIVEAYRLSEAGIVQEGPPPRTILLGCSPIGTIALAWSPLVGPLLPGLIVQVLLAAVMTVFGFRAERGEIAARRAQGLELPGLV
jgi:hypothetical protein